MEGGGEGMVGEVGGGGGVRADRGEGDRGVGSCRGGGRGWLMRRDEWEELRGATMRETWGQGNLRDGGRMDFRM